MKVIQSNGLPTRMRIMVIMLEMIIEYDVQELTEEKEEELVINKQYICSKYAAIAVIIKAATLIGKSSE